MSEKSGFVPPEASNALTPEKIHPNRQLWRDVLAGRGVNRDGTPRKSYTDEELKTLTSQVESAREIEDRRSWPGWVQKYVSNGVPTEDLLADLNVEAQHRSARAAAAETEASRAVVVAKDSVRAAEQGQQIEELQRQLLAANLQIARLTEANTRLLRQNLSLDDEVKRLRSPEPAKAVQGKVAPGGFLDKVFGSKKEFIASAAPVAEKVDEKPQTISAASERPVQWTEKMTPAELLELREKFTEGEAITETGRQLKIGPFLKAGLIGAVYPAVDEEGRRYAVKLPVANLSADMLVRFNEESAIIKKFGLITIFRW